MSYALKLLSVEYHMKIGVSYLSNYLRYILLAIAFVYITTYFIIAILRVQYPFEIEWVEGAMVDHVARVLSGEKLYVEPTLEFIPSLYNPLYFYLGAILSKLIGVSFTPLRLISFISSLGCFTIIFLIVKRETGKIFPSVLASCLFAASFEAGGAWLDIARPDTLFVFLFSISLYLVRFDESPKASVIAGVLITLAFLAKQTALAVTFPLFIYSAIFNRRQFIFFVGTGLFLLGISIFSLNYFHDNWYGYYSSLPKAYGFLDLETIIKQVKSDFIFSVPIAFLMAFAYVLYCFVNKQTKAFAFYFLVGSSMIGVSLVARSQPGGYLNQLMTAHIALSILFGLATNFFIDWSRSATPINKRFFESCIYLLCIVQFSILIYNPLREIPKQRDLEAGRIFINELAQIDGDVFVPYHGYLPNLAGKKSYAHHSYIADVIRTGNGEVNRNLAMEVSTAIRQQKFDAIVLDLNKKGNPPLWYPEVYQEVPEYYTLEKRIFDHQDGLWQFTGMTTRPELIYVPKR